MATIKDYPIDIEIDFKVDKARKTTDIDQQPDTDECVVSRIFFKGVEIVNEPLRQEIESYINTNPESIE